MSDPSAATKPGGTGRRVVARVIDVVLLAVCALVLSELTVYDERNHVERAVIAGSALACSMIYEILGIWRYGMTVGKRAVGLRVAPTGDATEISLRRAILRCGLFYIAGASTCGAGALLVAISPAFDRSDEQRGWHDRLAHTVVVRR
jgi:uncharacterized RDD family membrane protein YckC